MSMDRREFLKIAGISTIAGIGAPALFAALGRGNLDAYQVATDPRALQAKRWGFVIDISKLASEEDYKRCIDACHKIHNVPDIGNPKDEVKWIWKEEYEFAFPTQAEDAFMNRELKEKHFLLLCNHCAEPACVRVCPTKATFKRKDGIVMQDMHRCIGCRFCMAACPFGARSFNYRNPRGEDASGRRYIKEENKEFPTRMIGVVEKCTFCYERLAIGLQPACAEVSNGAIVVGDLDDPNSAVRKIIASTHTIRRKPELGTQPGIYYVIGGHKNV